MEAKMSIVDMYDAAVITTKLSIEPDNDLLIDQVLPDDVVKNVYEYWDDTMPVPLDYGGGEKGITCQMAVVACDNSYYKFSSLFDIPRNDAKDYLRMCNNNSGDGVYR